MKKDHLLTQMSRDTRRFEVMLMPVKASSTWSNLRTTNLSNSESQWFCNEETT